MVAVIRRRVPERPRAQSEGMDNTTLFAVSVSVLLVQAIALAQTWLQNREEIGIRDWSVAGLCLALGSLFGVLGINLLSDDGDAAIALMGELAAIAGSSAAVAGWCFVWLGARHFYARPAPGYMMVVHVTAIFTVVIALKLFVPLTMEWRTTWVSTAAAVFATLTLYEFLRSRPQRNPTVLLVITALLLTSVTWLVRGVASLDHEAYISDYAFTFPLALYDGIIASVTFTVGMIVLTNQRMHRRLRDQATIDPLTGIMNRRAFYDAANPILGALQRNENRVAVCLLDIDHFKQINDTHGHTVGDSVLEEFARRARSSLREGDLLARYGGEEFAILLHDSDPVQAEYVLRRLRQACAEEVVIPGQARIRLTFSAGICHASGPVHVALETLLEAADRALYSAKHSGRDRIVHALQHYSSDNAPRCKGVA